MSRNKSVEKLCLLKLITWSKLHLSNYLQDITGTNVCCGSKTVLVQSVAAMIRGRDSLFAFKLTMSKESNTEITEAI